MIPIDEMATFCKKKGFVYPSAEIYNGISGFFDFGALGVELKNNIKQAWWQFTVRSRDNVVGQDGSIITNPKVWKASGHVDNFADLILTTKKSRTKLRADHFIEDELKIPADGLSAKDIQELIDTNKLTYKGEEFEEIRDFNLMFQTNVGASNDKEATAYLRPETCQSIFPNFRLIQEHNRLKVPFGIAQIGKAFRNEISPRDFLFRSREFEQMELEFFTDPQEKTCPALTDVHKNTTFQFLSAQEQDAGTNKMETVSIQKLLDKEKLTEWHAYWLSEYYNWYTKTLSIKSENLRIREHVKTELSHYSSATFDIDYNFPFGFKEVHGSANRGSFDLSQHEKESKTNMTYFDEAEQRKYIPSVIEPSQGLDRLFLLMLYDAYDDDNERGNIVLKLTKSVVPIQCAVFPLLGKEHLMAKATEIYKDLQQEFTCTFDKSGSIGRRYARQDELGTPFCITVDFDTLENDDVTIRDRDSTKQVRVPVAELKERLRNLLKENIEFS